MRSASVLDPFREDVTASLKTHSFVQRVYALLSPLISLTRCELQLTAWVCMGVGLQ